MNEHRSQRSARTSHHSAYPADRIAAEREISVSVCLPARNEAGTIGQILERILPLREHGVLDQIVVADDSSDGTAEIARSLGADVVDQSALRAELGPVQGKGDAMWRALSVLEGEVVCYLDADSEDFGEHFVCGLVGPLVCDDPASRPHFVKSYYRRPFKGSDGGVSRTGGGRVSELLARPFLRRFFPELAVIAQPLSGEIAGRRALFNHLPMLCGYAVDVALLIDVWREVGMDGILEVDLDCRQNRHRPLDELAPMADAVLAAMVSRMDPPASEASVTGVVERPPAAWMGVP